MSNSLLDKLISSLINARISNSNLFTRPAVILWPDPEKQWESVIPMLQEKLTHLIVLGTYESAKKQGPAIWVKCMVSRTLPEANWAEGTIPVVYLPGMSKTDIRNTAYGDLELQPLAEYQYTGVMWLQENGKEWTVNAFLQNREEGMNIKIAQDAVTREILKKALPLYLTDSELLYVKERVDYDYLYNVIFPEFVSALLKWICRGDEFLKSLGEDRKEVFRRICLDRFGFEADHKNIKSIIEKLAKRKNGWEQVWQYYSHSPYKYPEVESWLRSLTPEGISLWSDEAEISVWPQLNDEKENDLRNALKKIAKMSSLEAVRFLQELQTVHSPRLAWVWAELGLSPLAKSVEHLATMTKISSESYPAATIEDIEDYYVKTGHQCDMHMRKAYAAIKTENDKEAVKNAITVVYKPWLENLTLKYQKHVDALSTGSVMQKYLDDDDAFVLFVDAFRYDIASEFIATLPANKYKSTITYKRCALPSLTPTAKPAVSPLADAISDESEFNEFRPQFKNGKDVTSPTFKDMLETKGFSFVNSATDIDVQGKHWQETGEIDTRGHEEQSGMIRRIPECLDKLHELIRVAFDKGIKRIKIVTDHGWLLLPGGLPKESMPADLTETRWGRCALLKEGVQSNLSHHPWYWNKNIYIAYAPGISFFKKNQEYAHGGISLQECVVPVITIENLNASVANAKIASVKWVNLRCNVETTGAPDGYQIDIRTKFTDSVTSVVLSQDKSLRNNRCSILIDDEAENQAVTIVLVDENGVIIDKKIGIAGNN
jgi:hypothetical protein